MKRLTLILSLLCTPAGAAVLPSWQMGGNPCLGACSASWAVREIRAGMGESWGDAIALAMMAPGLLRTIPAGSVVYAMSEGGPRMRYHRMTVPEDTLATTWTLHDGFVWAHFDQPGQCTNWAIVYIGGSDAKDLALWTSSVLQYGRSGYVSFGSFLAGPVYRSTKNTLGLHSVAVDGGGMVPGLGDQPPSPPVTTAPIPLPASLWLALATVGMMFLTRRRTR